MNRFSHISGDPTLDLINTVEWRLGGPDREEDLTTYRDVLDWCTESGLLDGEDRAVLTTSARTDEHAAEQERLAVIALREATYAALFERDEAAADRIVAACRDALTGARLRADGTIWRWRDDDLTLSVPRHRIARALVDLLRRDDLDRLHQCEDAKCGWVYLDTSPRRNRRWCVASDCGDRNRSRAYYARKTRG